MIKYVLCYFLTKICLCTMAGTYNTEYMDGNGIARSPILILSTYVLVNVNNTIQVHWNKNYLKQRKSIYTIVGSALLRD